jgi:hypothetical protein
VPVIIAGTTYRFLFDTGAPFSISRELQLTHSFKTVSRGNIIDSDHNRKKVDWVAVDKLQMGEVSFLNQTAFVGDFTANPLLKCLNIDGIIGGNLIRHCNWTIDQARKKLSLSSDIDDVNRKESISLPFKNDLQYNMFVDIQLGQTSIRNMMIDYGSNGSIAFNKDIFYRLKENGLIGETFLEKGVQQTGIIGEPVSFNREITLSDIISINDVQLNNVELRTGKTDLIGNKVLSRFMVTIDWDNKNLYLQEGQLNAETDKSFGFKIGFTEEKGFYVQSVLEKTAAHEQGIEPNMQVTKVDSLDFEKGNNFCDYAELETGGTVFLEVIDSEGNRRQFYIDKETLKK